MLLQEFLFQEMTGRGHNLLSISTGFILAVRLPMKKLAITPVNRESPSPAEQRPADTLTGRRTATLEAVSISLANAGVRFISHGVDMGMERNPSAYEME